MKFGLRNIRLLLRSVGNPQRRFSSIHVGGTNGKGSTSAFIASVFTEAGYRTGLYTSPHLVRFTERIRINGKEIPEERVAEYVAALRPTIERTQATFFEATTCIAFQYFADEQVDIAIVEVGLGGRLDSTNVIRPLVSVITNVGLEHTEYLGNTIPKIAREKAGIIKRGVPCVTASKDPAVVKVLRAVAKRRKSRLETVERLITARQLGNVRGCIVARFRSRRLTIARVKLDLAGAHQLVNAATALAALEIISGTNSLPAAFRPLDDDAVRRGLQNVRRNTGLRGRMEKFGSKILLDVAHNPDGVRMLVESLGTRKGVRYVVVFGVLKDKDYRTMCALLAPIVQHAVTVHPSSPRGLPASVLAKEFRRLGVAASSERSIRAGLTQALHLSGRGMRILVTGSHYVVGDALVALTNMSARA